MTIEKLTEQIYNECMKDNEPVTMAEAREMAEMELKARDINLGIRSAEPKAEKDKKPKVVKISDEKIKIFEDIVNFLQKNYNISIEKENKLIKIRENGKEFKLDLIQTREKKA